MRSYIRRHCERSEAIRLSLSRAVDCFASLMDAGFADTAHLSRVVSSMFGLSPSVAIAGLDERERE
jgi:hypothetical protein